MIIVYNSMFKNNYCSFQLKPIGSQCSLILLIRPYDLSCYLNIKLSKYDYLDKDIYDKYFKMINRTDKNQQEKNFNDEFLAFIRAIFVFTIILLVLFIGNMIHIKQNQNQIPHYLKYYAS